MVKNSAIFLVGLCLLLLFYNRWWLSQEIIGGDWPFFYQEAVDKFAFFPPAWSFVHGNGLGGTILSYSLDTYLYVTGTFSSKLHIPWSIAAKIFWYLSFVILSFTSTYILFRSLIREKKVLAVIAAIMYSANTYILMVSTGGQMGLGLAYAVVPAVMYSWIRFLTDLIAGKTNTILFYSVLLFSILFSIVIALDIRIAYIVVVALVCMAVVYCFIIIAKLHEVMGFLRRGAVFGLISLVIILLLQAYWLVPVLHLPKFTNTQLGIGENIVASLRFFSFANFSDALSLLHPNWPDNVFGKTYFLRPEFLLLPLLAFLPLFRLTDIVRKQKKEDRIVLVAILAFSLIALIGAFLGKGAREPFGVVYVWLFEHVPGFIFFRDPTKWYLLISLAYALLIPLGLFAVIKALTKLPMRNNYKKYITTIVITIVALYMVWLLRPILFEVPRGTLESKSIPAEYIVLKNKLLFDEQFYRILWVPRQQRYTFTTPTHPSVEAYPLFRAENTKSLFKKMSSASAEGVIKNAGIKYVILPYDNGGEIFLADRKYSEKERQKFENVLDKISWLTKIQDGKLTIYQVNNYKDLFTITSGDLQYYPEGQNYKLATNTTGPSVITFSQNYSSLWQAKLDTGRVLSPKKNKDGFMEFSVPEHGMHRIDVVYIGEKYFIIGRIITGLTVVILVVIFGMLQLKKS
jgi:hypothetical protein